MTDKSTGNGSEKVTSRRKLLKLGAAAVPAALTLRGGAAWAASVTCTVTIPQLNANFGLEPNDPRRIRGRAQIIPETTVFGAELKKNPDRLQPAQLRYLAQLEPNAAGMTCIISSGLTSQLQSYQ
ncbi:MAG: hypothetical protein PVF65_00630 [Sphingomonadales bacterium]